jgi:chromosome segregation ATPase
VKADNEAAERRLAEMKARLDAAEAKLAEENPDLDQEDIEEIVREKVEERAAQLEASYRERQSRAIAERVKADNEAAERRLAEMEKERREREEEVKLLRQKLNDAQKVDRKIVDELVAAKTAEKLAELEEEKHALDEKFKEAHERHEATVRSYEDRKRELEDHVAAKIREIEKEAKLDKDVGTLEEERKNLSLEVERMKSEIEQEKENFRIREKLRKMEHADLYSLPQLLFLVKENLSDSPDSCGLSLDEMMDLEKLLESIGSLASETLIAIREILDGLKRKGGIRLVQ